MKIYFARHGESQANQWHVFCNHGRKHPLTQIGRQQVSALAEKLGSQAITRIYTSPVLRAVETAVYLAHKLAVEYEISEALRECDAGDLEGRTDEAAWQAWREVFEDWINYQRWEVRLPGGESYNDVQNRFLPFIASLIQEYQDRDGQVLCVAHGGLYWTMLPQVLQNIDLEFIAGQGGIDYAALVVAEYTPSGLVCTEWNAVHISL